MKCKRGIAAVCISAVLGCSALPAAALEPPAIGLQPAESVELSALAESEIEVHLKNETPLATETTYDNLQTFIAKAREQSDASDAEIAKTLLCRIGSADLAEAYTVEQLSEVLNYAEIVRSTVIIGSAGTAQKRRSQRRRLSTQGDARWSPPARICGRVGKPRMTGICRSIPRVFV